LFASTYITGTCGVIVVGVVGVVVFSIAVVDVVVNNGMIKQQVKRKF
jgi:hypothetical protein